VTQVVVTPPFLCSHSFVSSPSKTNDVLLRRKKGRENDQPRHSDRHVRIDHRRSHLVNPHFQAWGIERPGNMERFYTCDAGAMTKIFDCLQEKCGWSAAQIVEFKMAMRSRWKRQK
jgi:hypothetical protein